MKGKSKFLLASMLSFALVISAVTVFAVNEIKSIKSMQNDFKPAEIGIAVQENADNNSSPNPDEKEMYWEESSDSNTYTAKKEVQILNRTDGISNPVPAFIRVSLIPRWTATVDGAEVDVTNVSGVKEMGTFAKSIVGNSYTMGDITFTLDNDWNTNWIYGNDGYFYCRKAVEAGSTTPLLLKSVLISSETYSKTENQEALVVDVVADSIQTEGQDSGEASALIERWGTPDKLGIKVSEENGELILKEYLRQSDAEGGDRS